MKAGVLFSGGKDSTYAAYLAREEHDVRCLTTLDPARQDSYMFHFPNLRLTALQAKSMRIPQITVPTEGEKEVELQDLSRALRMAKEEYSIQAVLSGALASVNQTLGRTTTYFHEDALGSVRLVTSSSGTTLFSSDYKPYGTIWGAYGSTVFEYTAKPTDPATGLYYSTARFFDPASGRFMTEDSTTGSQTAPLTLNRYICADDNPHLNPHIRACICPSYP